MTKFWWKDAERDETHEAAADWFARLQRADVSAEELLAWQRWMAAHPHNAEAFARLEEVCVLLRTIKRPRRRSSSLLPERSYDGSVPISDWRRRSPLRPWLAVAASVAIAVVVVGWGAREHGIRSTAGRQVIQTRVGENRTVQLADGSRITLGGNTRVRTLVSATERNIELDGGEAYFAVMKDPRRPFRVQAGETSVTAIGTEFDVRRRQDHVDVTVVEGQVFVNPARVKSMVGRVVGRKTRLEIVRVVAGEKVTISELDVKPASVENTRATAAWRSGRLVFDGEPLRDVLEDVNRYSRKRIEIADPAIRDLMFTGTVMDGNVEAWLSSIERIFSLTAAEEPGRIVLRRR